MIIMTMTMMMITKSCVGWDDYYSLYFFLEEEFCRMIMIIRMMMMAQWEAGFLYAYGKETRAPSQKENPLCQWLEQLSEYTNRRV